MELLTGTAGLATGVLRAFYIFLTETFFRLRQIFRSASTYVRANTLLLIVGALVAISGVYMNFYQTEIMTGIDKIYECGPTAFGVDVGAPLSVWNVAQGVYSILTALRGWFLSSVMRVNSALVWSRQAILTTFNFIRDIQDKTSPSGVLATIQALYELPFLIANLIIEIPIFQIPIFDTIFTTIYLFFQCLALLAQEVAVGFFQGALYSQNENVCMYKTQFLDPTTYCYTTEYNALIFTNEDTAVNCTEGATTNILCTFIECLAFSTESIFSWTKPCFGYDVAPLVRELSAAGCCFTSTIDRGIFIGVSVLENWIFTILYGSSDCMPLTELVNQVGLLTTQFLSCVDDIICVFTGGDVCDFVQGIIDWIVNNILYFIDAIAALGTCSDQFVCADWPLPGCTTGQGFADCFENYFVCLEQTPFWQTPGWTIFFDFVYQLLIGINGALCGPFCVLSDPVADCITNYPNIGLCPPGGDGPTATCWELFATCMEGYSFWVALSGLLDFITQILIFLDAGVCFATNYILCVTTLFNPSTGVCAITSPNFDVVVCFEDLLNCLNPFTLSTPMAAALGQTAIGFLASSMVSSVDVPIRQKVEFCLLNGMMHNNSMCMNGCRFDPTSCLNDTIISHWNEPGEAVKLLELQMLDHKDLLRGECGGPKFFLTNGLSQSWVHFTLPQQKADLKAYHACILKDSYDHIKTNYVDRMLSAMTNFQTTARRRTKRYEPPGKCEQVGLLTEDLDDDRCMIELYRYEDEDYMDRAKRMLFITDETKTSFKQAAKQLYTMFINSAPAKYVRNLSEAARYNVTNDRELHRQVCERSSSARTVNLFHTEKEKYVAVNSMLLCNCLSAEDNNTIRTEYYKALDLPHKVTRSGQMSCREMKKSVERMAIVMKMEAHKRQFEEDYDHMTAPFNREGVPLLLRLYQTHHSKRLNGLAESARRYRQLYRNKPTYVQAIMEPSWKQSPSRRRILDKMTGLYGGQTMLGNGQTDLFGTVLNNTFCFVNGFSVIPGGPMPVMNPVEEDFEARQDGRPLNFTMFQMQHEKLKKHGFYDWLPFAERVVTSAVNNFGIDQYGIYKHGHMFYHAVTKKQSHKIVHYMNGDYDWDMVNKEFSLLENTTYPFEVKVPPGPPIWDASNGLSTNLGIFVFFNVTISTFFAWAGYGDLNLAAASVMATGYKPVYNQLYDSLISDDETNCYSRGSYRHCVRLQSLARTGENGEYKRYNKPRQVFMSKEEFQSDQAYERYLVGAGNPADFNANKWFEDLVNYLGTLLFGTVENAFTDIVNDVTDIVESVNVTKEFIIFLQKLDVATACTWPDQVNGSTVYNPFCFPLLPATLGSWITPLPTTFLQPQIPWPKELITEDCVNVYNGKTFLPTLDPAYLSQSPILRLVNRGFQFSNNCRIDIDFGYSVLAHPNTNQMMVGAPGAGQSGGKSGSVLIYPLDSSTVSQTLYALDVTQAEEFGRDLSAWGAGLAVGAPFGQRGNGYVALYDFDGTNWIIRTNLSFLEIQNPLTIANNQGDAGMPYFGGAVLLNDQYVIVGAPAWNASKGAVYVYLPGEEMPLQMLTDAGALPSLSFFGYSLAMPRDTSEWLIVGQPLWNSSIGQIFVHRRNTTDNTFYLFQVITYPEILEAIAITDANLRPKFGFDLTMADDVPEVFCAGAPVGVFAGAAGTVYCYKFNGSDWVLSITITAPPLSNPGGFGVGVHMNSTTLYVTQIDSNEVNVYEFNGAYTSVTLLYSIDLTALGVAGFQSAAVDITDDGFWITGQFAMNGVVYGNSATDNNGTQILFSNGLADRPFCPDGCDYCPRTYIEGGCRALKFKDFLDTLSFLLALVPAALNFLFVNGLSLKYLEQVYSPIVFILDVSRLQILLPNTRAMYLFLWFLELVFQRDLVPIAPLLVITIIAFYIGINNILPFFLPGVSDLLSKIQPASFGLLFAAVAFLLIGQAVSLFIAFNGFSFSINKILVDFITDVQGSGYLFFLIPALDIAKFKLQQFIYENPSDIPWADAFCFFWTYYNLGLMIVAGPLAFFLLLILSALFNTGRTLITSIFSALSTWAAIVFASFRTNRA